MPKDWKTGMIVSLHKKGDKLDCNNCRGINLFRVVMKISIDILDRQWKNYCMNNENKQNKKTTSETSWEHNRCSNF